MYGKDTRARLGRETVWCQPPESPWVAAAVLDGSAATARTDLSEFASGSAIGAAYATARLDTLPDALNIAALSEAALSRDEFGEMASYTVGIADSDGACEIRGALVRRFKVKCGVARPALELALEFVGRTQTATPAFDRGPAGRPFSFSGSSMKVGTEVVPGKEFSISVNNNVFTGPAQDDFGAGFITAGRQALTGYIIVASDVRHLVDEDEHSLEITLPGGEVAAVIRAEAVFFTWCREIRSLAAGGLGVLYFEGASASLDAGLTIGLS